MKSPHSIWIRFLGAAVFVGLLAWAGSYTVRIYIVDRLVETVTLENLEKAVRLAPRNSNAWSRLGMLLDRQGDSRRAAEALDRAVRLNPYSGPAWVELGLHWELQGDPQRARQCLTEAARVDRSFHVRWALVNFYLRQGDEQRFWSSMRDALSHSRTDLDAAFDLCWRAYPDADLILEKAIPDEIETLRRYSSFLVETGRTAALAGVWKRIENHLEQRDLDDALHYADLLLTERQVDAAIEVWNRLCALRLLPLEPLDRARGRLLTNGKFQFQPLSLAFDWRLRQIDGVSIDLEADGGEPRLAIRFNGAHPESAELLSQWAPAEPNQTYRLKFQYLTSGLPNDSGLHWRVVEETGGEPKALESVLPSTMLSSEGQWKEAEVAVRTGPRTRLLRLALSYRRSPGTTRSEGSVFLSNVDLLPHQLGTLARRVRP